MTIKKIAFSSKASQDNWEVYQVLKQVAEIKPKVIVEIGVDGGGFLDTLTQAFPKAKIIGIDINKRAELDKYDMLYGDSNDSETVANLKAKLGDRQIDFLWIDGDHHYEAAKSDYNMYKQLVRLGGIIGFHDTNNRGIDGVDVDKLMRELDDWATYRTADFRTNKQTPGVRLIWR